MTRRRTRRRNPEIAALKVWAEYIHKYVGKTFVLKLGGEVLEQPLGPLAYEASILYGMGINFVIVPGGGNRITRYSEEIGLETERVHGLRITTPEILEQAVIPVMGEINAEIVEALGKCGVEATGLQRADISGSVPDLITAKKTPPKKKPGSRTPEDLDLVGDVVDVNKTTLDSLINQRKVPVISSLGMDPAGAIYNINADDVAGGIAKKLGVEKLIILTDVLGIYRHPTKRREQLIPYMDTKKARRLIREKKVTKGGLPKLWACIYAVEGGVRRAHVVKGTYKKAYPYRVIGEVLGTKGTGTMVLTPQERRVYERELRTAHERELRRRG